MIYEWCNNDMFRFTHPDRNQKSDFVSYLVPEVLLVVVAKAV